MDWTCERCGHDSYSEGDGDGFYYCDLCSAEVKDIVDTQINEEDFHNEHYKGSHFRVRVTPKSLVEPMSQPNKLSQTLHSQFSQAIDEDQNVNPGDGVGPTEPTDFGTFSFNAEDYSSEIRLRYVMGIQIMIQLQCKALIKNFNTSTQIVTLISPIWLRFLSSTKIMSDEWADQVINESETIDPGKEDDIKEPIKHKNELRNIFGKRAVMLWYRYLTSTIPLSYSLAITFLICHVAKEPILPIDILKGALEGKIPYFSAFIEIEKQLGSPSNSCPFSSILMFKPMKIISSQKLEFMSVSIAQKIQLDLPSLNFKALISRFLRELSLPVTKILSQACLIYKWLKPPGLYLSVHELSQPSRVRVMSILIVAIRMLYDLNGFGIWESSLTNEEDDNIESDDDSKLKDGVEILRILETKYNELNELRNTFDHSKDLESYLRYCKDVVFAGSEPSFEDHEETKVISDLWEYYQNSEVLKERKKLSKDESSQSSVRDKSYKERAIKEMKRDMEENKFCYIPPRSNMKCREYLCYPRKKKEGGYIYVCHADYYILLRSCAKIIEVDVRTMHNGVLSFERRLQVLEERMNCCLRDKVFEDYCQVCVRALERQD